MNNEFTYYKVCWQEYNYGVSFGYYEHKEKVLYSLFEAREFKKCMEDYTGEMAEIRKITEKMEIVD